MLTNAKTQLEVMELSADELGFSLRDSEKRFSFKEPVILKNNNELSKRICSKTGSAKYKVIAEYILELLDGQDIIFPDGRRVTVNKSDASHISRKADNKKISEISELKSLINRAHLILDDTEFEHKKFTHFAYYETSVKLGEDIFNLVFNIGKGKSDKKYHLYEINHPKSRNTGNDRIVLGSSADKRTIAALDTGASEHKLSQTVNKVKQKDTKKSLRDKKYLEAAESGQRITLFTIH